VDRLKVHALPCPAAPGPAQPCHAPPSLAAPCGLEINSEQIGNQPRGPLSLCVGKCGFARNYAPHRQAARVLNTSSRFVEAHVSNGDIPSVKLGKLRRIHRDVIELFMQHGIVAEAQRWPRLPEDAGR
jgi:excisionase family DNA binding protein